AQLKKSCKDFMYKNNYKRAIKQLGWKTPFQFEESIKGIPEELRPKKKMHDFSAQEKVGGFGEA
ncbi:MAG: hypothetical protein KDC25_09205, partial [Saprospiraceae bacterium]|nr:hypothetical protein [Saprospiraceae bacterium]